MQHARQELLGARAFRRRNWGLAPVVAALVAVLTLVPAAATAAPTAFSLTFEGAHVPDDDLVVGLRHEGRFTASAPFCSAGRSYDTHQFEGEPLAVLRIHVCDDGSGSFTASMPVVRNEHGGTGTWKIVEGSGQYATLRGLGTYTGTLISGNPDLFDTIVYRTIWEGVVAFDADPPAIETFSATARKLRKPARTYRVRVALAFREASAPVSYVVVVKTGKAVLAVKRGSTAEQATVTLRIRRPRTARSVAISLTAQDALGTETTASRSLRLR